MSQILRNPRVPHAGIPAVVGIVYQLDVVEEYIHPGKYGVQHLHRRAAAGVQGRMYALCSKPFRNGSRNSACKVGSPPETVTPPPKASKNT